MKFIKLVFTLALACGLGLALAGQAAPQQASESHATHADMIAVPAPAQRWVPDAALREGMRRARTAVRELHQYELGHMSESMAMNRATEVEQAVAYMLANCKLTPEPDAALHSILVPLLTAAHVLKADPENLKPVADMRAAIAHYPQYFTDPGWDKPASVEPVMPKQS